MKKTAIITFHAAHNYGAVLQAYALQQIILRFGFQCDIIDILTKQEKNNLNIIKPTFKFNGLMKNLLSLYYYKQLKEKYRLFQKFIHNNLILTVQSFSSCKEIENANLDYDYYISGSDQIWNHKFIDNDLSFFLSFVKKGIKIAYAPSVGSGKDIEQIPIINQVQKHLKDYNYLSARDITTADIIERLTNKKVKIVLDPTLLLDTNDLLKITSPKKHKDKYIFFYVVKNHKYYYKIARKISEYLKLPVITSTLTGKGDFFNGFKFDFAAGPSEFISLIQNAEFVVTSSFHGTIFSILNKKPFICMDAKNDIRLSNLLSLLDLDKRSATLENLNDILPFIYDIDFDKVNQKLLQHKKYSMDFLKSVLDIKD